MNVDVEYILYYARFGKVHTDRVKFIVHATELLAFGLELRETVNTIPFVVKC